MKLTGNSIRLYLSISEGDMPPSFWRFFLQWSRVGGWWSISWGPGPPWTPRRPLEDPLWTSLIIFGPPRPRRKGSCMFKRISCNSKQLNENNKQLHVVYKYLHKELFCHKMLLKHHRQNWTGIQKVNFLINKLNKVNYYIFYTVAWCNLFWSYCT